MPPRRGAGPRRGTRPGLINLVRDAGGISPDALTARVARLYGWTRRGPDITARLDALVGRLLASGALAGDADNLTPAA